MIEPYEPLSAGRWVRHKSLPVPEDHVCQPPLVHNGKFAGQAFIMVPGGELGDLWRCPCWRLWRVGVSCDACDQAGGGGGRCPRGGYHPRVLVWRPAKWWQRLIHWRPL